MATPTPAQLQLASVLKGLRNGTGMSTYDLAQALGWSQAKVSRIENARSKPTADDVEAWAEATGATAPIREQVSLLVSSALTDSQSWRASHRSGLAARQQEMRGMDREASEIRNFQPSVIPGLLQTESYARRVLTMADVTNKGGIDAAVAARMKRQAILTTPGHSFRYVVTEGTLRWRPGPRQMMTEQLGKLLAVAAMPNVTLGVIPYDREARSRYTHGFTLFYLPDGPVVLAEGFVKEDIYSDPRDVETFEGIFDLLMESALQGDAAADFARSVMA
jgi:transcriptional regulator with XRE-family HTH domain